MSKGTKLGLWLLWSSIFGTFMLVGSRSYFGFALALLIPVGLGIATFVLYRKAPSRLWFVNGVRNRLLTAAMYAGAFIGAFWGLAGFRGEVEKCDQFLSHIRSYSAETLPLDRALQLLEQRRVETANGLTTCRKVGNEKGVVELEHSLADTTAQISAGNAKGAEAEVAAKLKKVGELEASWPRAQKEILTKLKEGERLASASKWSDAFVALAQAHESLESFNGTQIQGNPDWESLKKRKSALAERTKGPLEKIAKERERLEKLRGEEPEFIGGTCWPCHRYLLATLNDPDSFEHVRSSIPTAEGEYWVVSMAYRAKNAFGGKILAANKFWIQGGQVVKASKDI